MRWHDDYPQRKTKKSLIKKKADLGFRSVFLILYSTSQNFGFQDFAHTNQGLSEVPLP